ncbi:hypothetical protein IFR05_010948 [Cadophora sp. M221]|nr:hypothetical protein IFR05_010948 [Cadophora sp. M221]
MHWTVIEDPKLDNFHYAVAARRFGDWVKTSVSEEAKSTVIPPSNLNFPKGWQPGMDPRHDAFIYANEDVVNSVVDHPEGEDNSQVNSYFVYLANYDMIQEQEKNIREIIDMLARRDTREAVARYIHVQLGSSRALIELLGLLELKAME